MKILNLLILSFLFCGNLDAVPVKVFARATAYHKTHSNADSNTKKGLSSTKIRLRDNCEDSIGIVAVDPQKIPYGSLIYSPNNKRFYLACDFGEAVADRSAAKKTAKKKDLPPKYHKALVFDFYAKREILEDDFDYFFVIKHDGDLPFWKLYEEYQRKRLDPKFWVKRVESMLDFENIQHRKALEEILRRLEDMD